MDRRDVLIVLRRKTPVSILTICAVSWLLIAQDIYFVQVFGTRPNYWNPVVWIATLVFHSGPEHMWNNVRALLLFGIPLTLLTTDEHVLGLVLVANVMSTMMYAAGGGFGRGASTAVFAIFAALIVRSTGDAMQDQPMDTMLGMVGGMLLPFAVVLYFLVIVVDIGPTAHMAHFIAFSFGALYEIAFVAAGHSRGERLVLTYGGLRAFVRTMH